MPPPNPRKRDAPDRTPRTCACAQRKMATLTASRAPNTSSRRLRGPGDCAVPAINLVSNEGTGFKNSIIGLDGTQLDVAAVCTGIARVAISEAVS